MFQGIYPVSQQLYNEMQELDEHWFYRFKYRFPNPILVFDDDLISIVEHVLNREFNTKINQRNEFKKKYDFNLVMNDPLLKYSNDNLSIIKHYTITYDLPKYLKQKRTSRTNRATAKRSKIQSDRLEPYISKLLFCF